MHITIYGASGKVGKLVTQRALDAGHTVTAFVHSHELPFTHPKLTIQKGSTYEYADVLKAIQGSDAVIVTLGSWRAKKSYVVSSGIKHILIAMETQKIRRVITLTGSAAYYEGDTPTWQDRVGRAIARTIAKDIHEDGEAHLRLLANSQLDWTCIRSPAMTKHGAAAYRLTAHLKPLFATIPRTAVATCLIDQLTDTTWVRQAPTIRKK
jgi:putative NADH-flavin reductase